MNTKLELELEKKLAVNDGKKFKFSELVENISEKVTPKTCGLDFYIGLEHLDSGSIHIKRFGDTKTLEGDKLKIYKGDIIFAKRNAYLKRVALAPFDAVASAHSLVLRVKGNETLKKILPFFLLSETFWERAIEISVGSLSPTINWKSIAQQEFLLPPDSEQKWLANIFCSFDELIQSEINLLNQLKVTHDVQRKSFIENGASKTEKSKSLRFGNVSNDWDVKELKSFCTLVGGGAFQSSRFKNEGEHQVLRIGNLSKEGLSLQKQPVFIDDIADVDRKYFVPEKAIIVSLTGTNGKRDYGFPYLVAEGNKYLLNQRLAMIKVDEDIMLPEFLYLLAKMELFQGRFFLNATGSANQANVSMVDIGKIQLPVPPIFEQQLILKKMDTIVQSIISTEKQLLQAKQTFKSLVNKVF